MIILAGPSAVLGLGIIIAFTSLIPANQAAVPRDISDLITDVLDNAIEVSGGQTSEGNKPSDNVDQLPAESVPGAGASVPKVQRKYEPACFQDLNDISISCLAINEQCSAGDGGALMRVLEAPAGQNPPEWRDTNRTVCRYRDQPLGPVIDEEQELPTVTIEFFRRLPIQPSNSEVQPAPDTLIGANTNVYARPAPQTFVEVLDGHDVSIRAIPTSYTWNYGDGTTLGPVPEPGGPLPTSRIGERTPTSHRYSATGDLAVVLTTTYRGEYSIDGMAWIGIDGQASVASPAVGLRVWRSVVNNYADNCLENPNGAGC
jgi:hypothetical protein